MCGNDAIEGFEICDGTIDVIASGHAPRSSEKKMRELDLAPFGAVALETTLALVITELIEADHLSWPEAIAKLITTDQTHQISSQLQMGRDQGMQVLDSALLEAINNKEIDPDDAIRFAVDKKKFQRFVTDTDLVPILDIGDQSKI